MKRLFALLLLPALPLFAHLEDLEENLTDFVLETKQIKIPEYPQAFNPSIIRWQNSLLLIFRFLPDPKNSFTSQFGITWLDEDFNPIGEPQPLTMRDRNSKVPPRAEDPRLIEVDNRLYVVYSDNSEPQISKGGFRLYIAELLFENGLFTHSEPVCLSQFEGESKNVREKNWVPFDWMGNLLLAYSLDPHMIFSPYGITGRCLTLCRSKGTLEWPWGELRGGTPALKIGDEYLSFFHSSKKIETAHSGGKKMLHYMIGAYTFSAEYPFAITRISSRPIIGKDFYRGTPHPTYKNWSSMRGVFPCGYLIEKGSIWIAYGKQDHEIWIAKLDLEKLLESLAPVSSLYEGRD